MSGSDSQNNIPSELLEGLSFSDTAKQMADLKAIIFNTPETNQAKIQFIKEEIDSGRYQIDSQEIAKKIIKYHQLIEPLEPA